MWYTNTSHINEGMNIMAEFCKCGSVMISGNCTNKNCGFKVNKVTPVKPGKTISNKTAAAAKPKTPTKSTKVPRASKCITYKLSDLPPKEE